MPRLEDAYRVEMAVLPIILDMEIRGVRINPIILEEKHYWQEQFDKGDEYIRKISGEKPGTKKCFMALRQQGLIDESKITYTDKGNPQYGRDKLEECVVDSELKEILSRRSKLQKALGTYINPWYSSFLETGRFYPYFNQVMGEKGGTKTGRMSSNLQQIPRKPDKNEDMPNLRKLIAPDDDDSLIIKRDFNSQEIRVAAHYAEGNILDAYLKNPRLDVHNFVSDLIQEKTGMRLSRVVVKTINFLKLYGGGPPKLASKLNISIDNARDFFEAYDRALPEFRQLTYAIEHQVRRGTLLRTWGGRLYDVEPASRVNGRLREWYYKLPNLLIQGSSADQTKVAMIRFSQHPDRKGRIILQVHDELVVSSPKQYVHSDMKILKWAMDDIPGWDVPMMSEGMIGKNFGELEDYVE